MPTANPSLVPSEVPTSGFTNDTFLLQSAIDDEGNATVAALAYTSDDDEFESLWIAFALLLLLLFLSFCIGFYARRRRGKRKAQAKAETEMAPTGARGIRAMTTSMEAGLATPRIRNHSSTDEASCIQWDSYGGMTDEASSPEQPTLSANPMRAKALTLEADLREKQPRLTTNPLSTRAKALTLEADLREKQPTLATNPLSTRAKALTLGAGLSKPQPTFSTTPPSTRTKALTLGALPPPSEWLEATSDDGDV